MRLACLLISLLLFATPALAAERARTEHLFMCPCDHCKGKWLPNCANKGCGPAQQLRAWLIELEQQGKTDVEVRQAVTARYGTRLVANPGGGAGWAAYLLPLLALLAGGALITWIGKRWVARGAPTTESAPQPLSADQQAKVEAALEELEQ